MFPQKPILASEATEVREENPANPVWGKGEHYAHDIIGDINNWVVGFIVKLADQYDEAIQLR